MALAVCLFGTGAGCDKVPQQTDTTPAVTDGKTTGGGTEKPADDVKITVTSPFHFDYTASGALAATPNKLADGYIKSEEKVLENFEEDIVTSVSGLTVSYTEKRKTDGARSRSQPRRLPRAKR